MRKQAEETGCLLLLAIFCGFVAWHVFIELPLENDDE